MMATARPCCTCQKPTTHGAYCPACQRAAWAKRQKGRSQPAYSTPEYRAQRAQLIKAQPWCGACFAVGSQQNPLTIDHIQSLHHGGTNAEENLRVLCRRCNSKRQEG